MGRKWRVVLLALAAVLAVCAAGFFVYTADYYPADTQALAVYSEGAGVETEVRGNLTVLTPEEPNGTGLIFYPGAKVEHTAYLPLLERLCRQGVTCVLVEMPFRLAVLAPDAAGAAFAQAPEVERWYIGGHSLGGAMASRYAAAHPEEVEGAVLLGAYVYGGLLPERALTVYGSEDLVLDRDKITYSENVVELPGGNHAQFGNYGPQKGDGAASISAGEQQSLTAEAVLAFMG